jgi:hypothetical protein
MDTTHLGHSGSVLESGGLRQRSVRLSLGVALGLGVLLAALLLLSASGPQARAGLAPAAAVASQAAAARRWLSETVDSSGDMRWSASLALEPTAPYTPHISYHDDTNTALKHAWWTPSGWLSETVDNSGSVGAPTSLALEPVAPYTPHISYRDYSNYNLKHAWRTSSGWLSETVDNSADVGGFNSLALEPVAPYTPHISYRDNFNTALKHAWWTPSGWLSETVDNSADVGTHTSLALEAVAPCAPHISYWDFTNQALKHAWWTPSGWLSETIDSSGSVGWVTSLALEPVAPYTPHISHYDNTNDTLKHAWWTPSGWLSETVDNSGAVGYYTSLALEPAPPYAPHISYQGRTNDTLKHAWLTVYRWVLFDEAHDESNTLSWARAQQIEPGHPEWVYFGELSSTLASEFTLVRNPDAPLTLQLLQGYDALVLSAPLAEFTEDEIAAIQLFVDSGGGLIVLGDCGLEHPANVFLSDYDIALDEHCIFSPIPQLEGDFAVTEFASHPAVTGVSSFVTNWGQSLELGSGATDLAWTGDNVWQDYNWNDTYDAGTDPTGPFAVMAGYDTGCGRVAVVSDNSFQDDGFEWRGNAPLMRALLHWVTGGPQCGLPSVYLPLTLRDAP